MYLVGFNLIIKTLLEVHLVRRNKQPGIMQGRVAQMLSHLTLASLAFNSVCHLSVSSWAVTHCNPVYLTGEPSRHCREQQSPLFSSGCGLKCPQPFCNAAVLKQCYYSNMHHGRIWCRRRNLNYCSYSSRINNYFLCGFSVHNVIVELMICDPCVIHL